MGEPITQLQVSDLEDDIAAFIASRLPQAKIETFFDVGANVGWYTLMFLRVFPAMRAWAFEPVSSTHQQMMGNLSRFHEANPFPRTECVKAGLGASSGFAEITNYPGYTVNRIHAEHAKGVPTERVPIFTGDDFCSDHSIEHIDFLKIDAEGYDLKVLEGFSGMLKAQEIDFIQVEAGMTTLRSEFVAYETINEHLRKFDYHLFRVTNQCSDNIPFCSRADVVFINRLTAERYRYS